MIFMEMARDARTIRDKAGLYTRISYNNDVTKPNKKEEREHTPSLPWIRQDQQPAAALLLWVFPAFGFKLFR